MACHMKSGVKNTRKKRHRSRRRRSKSPALATSTHRLQVNSVDDGALALTWGRPIPKASWQMAASQPLCIVKETSMSATASAEKAQPATRFAKDQLKAFVERIERLE